MEDTTATSKSDELVGQALVVSGKTPAAIVIGGRFIAVDEIAFATNTNEYPANLGTTGDHLPKPVDGCRIEFKRKGSIFVPGLTVEGLGALVNGSPF